MSNPNNIVIVPTVTFVKNKPAPLNFVDTAIATKNVAQNLPVGSMKTTNTAANHKPVTPAPALPCNEDLNKNLVTTVDLNKTKKVANSWASNYLQSIGSNKLKPIKINLSSFKTKTPATSRNEVPSTTTSTVPATVPLQSLPSKDVTTVSSNEGSPLHFSGSNAVFRNKNNLETRNTGNLKTLHYSNEDHKLQNKTPDLLEIPPVFPSNKIVTETNSSNTTLDTIYSKTAPAYATLVAENKGEAIYCYQAATSRNAINDINSEINDLMMNIPNKKDVNDIIREKLVNEATTSKKDDNRKLPTQSKNEKHNRHTKNYKSTNNSKKRLSKTEKESKTKMLKEKDLLAKKSTSSRQLPPKRDKSPTKENKKIKPEITPKKQLKSTKTLHAKHGDNRGKTKIYDVTKESLPKTKTHSPEIHKRVRYDSGELSPLSDFSSSIQSTVQMQKKKTNPRNKRNSDDMDNDKNRGKTRIRDVTKVSVRHKTKSPETIKDSPERHKRVRYDSGDVSSLSVSPTRRTVQMPESVSVQLNKQYIDENFDLRSKLSRVNQRIERKRHNTEKEDTTPSKKKSRENLKITVENYVENHKSPNKAGVIKTYKTKNNKCKKIKLIINVVCEEESDESSGDSSDCSISSNNPSKTNLDLSFLDDFNVDEIVDSLKYTPTKLKIKSPMPQNTKTEDGTKIKLENEQTNSTLLDNKSGTNNDNLACSLSGIFDEKPIKKEAENNKSEITLKESRSVESLVDILLARTRLQLAQTELQNQTTMTNGDDAPKVKERDVAAKTTEYILNEGETVKDDLNIRTVDLTVGIKCNALKTVVTDRPYNSNQDELQSRECMRFDQKTIGMNTVDEFENHSKDLAQDTSKQEVKIDLESLLNTEPKNNIFRVENKYIPAQEMGNTNLIEVVNKDDTCIIDLTIEEEDDTIISESNRHSIEAIESANKEHNTTVKNRRNVMYFQEDIIIKETKQIRGRRETSISSTTEKPSDMKVTAVDLNKIDCQSDMNVSNETILIPEKQGTSIFASHNSVNIRKETIVIQALQGINTDPSHTIDNTTTEEPGDKEENNNDDCQKNQVTSTSPSQTIDNTTTEKARDFNADAFTENNAHGLKNITNETGNIKDGQDVIHTNSLLTTDNTKAEKQCDIIANTNHSQENVKNDTIIHTSTTTDNKGNTSQQDEQAVKCKTESESEKSNSKIKKEKPADTVKYVATDTNGSIQKENTNIEPCKLETVKTIVNNKKITAFNEKNKKTENNPKHVSKTINNKDIAVKENKKILQIKPAKIENEHQTIPTDPNANSKEEKAEPLSGQHKAMSVLLEERMLEYMNKEYKIVSLIKSGCFSNVYRCKDVNGQIYAAKVIKEESNRFIMGVHKEQMIRKLQGGIPQENLNTVYLIDGFGVSRSWCFLTEYYPSNLLEAILRREKPFFIDQVQNLARQLISAVTILRNNHIVHSDIKPAHILINATEDRIKLCGFDRAYYINNEYAVPNIGTSAYRPPEVILGFSAGYSIDVWTVALVILLMATQIKLFVNSFNNDILYQQMCTFGELPQDMVENSPYSYQHFCGGTFVRRFGTNGQNVIGMAKFNKSNILSNILKTNYFKYCSTRNAFQRKQDKSKSLALQRLLEQMLMLDPRRRIAIEFAYADPFIIES